MGLTQEFTGLIEPADPDWARAPALVRKRYYDQAGTIILDELKKQLERGVGRPGRAMKPRIQAVLPDGADGPVMIPHELASRAITMSDYAATDHSLKLFWHAGTGHRQARRQRARGKKPVPFGEILRYHADGEVPNAPVRDVRLCAQRIANVKRRLGPVWDRLKPQVRRAPESTPAPAPKPKGKSFSKAQQRKFTPPPIGKIPKQTKPDTTVSLAKHPTPTHPIPVHRTIPKTNFRGPIHVVSGGRAKPPPKKPKPAPAPKPPTPAPVVPPEPLPQPFYPPKPKQTAIERAIEYGRSKGIEVRFDTPSLRALDNDPTAKQQLAFYRVRGDFIGLNADHVYWQKPVGYMHIMHHEKRWFSTDDPEHIIRHEVGHALHARAVGSDVFGYNERFARIEDVATAMKVSRYAGQDRYEFVAETYAGMVAGKHYDDDVRRLYEQLGGPNVR